MTQTPEYEAASQKIDEVAAIAFSIKAERDRILAENAKLREALKAYLSAKPQCECTPHSGCQMAEAGAKARAALQESGT